MSHQSYGASQATQCKLPPDTSERAQPNPCQTCWY